MGKSRLLFEFRHGISDRRVTYVEGQCASYGATTPYLPIIDIIRQAGGIRDTDPSEIIVSKVRASLQAVGLDPDQEAQYLLSLLGVKETFGQNQLSPEIVKARTFDVIR